ncbi:MAG: hypothetical protein JO054_03330 [Actinobacteria bacterium]|nr:hypothetical protein [Actinomycetota bacterium]
MVLAASTTGAGAGAGAVVVVTSGAGAAVVGVVAAAGAAAGLVLGLRDVTPPAPPFCEEGGGDDGLGAGLGFGAGAGVGLGLGVTADGNAVAYLDCSKSTVTQMFPSAVSTTPTPTMRKSGSTRFS